MPTKNKGAGTVSTTDVSPRQTATLGSTAVAAAKLAQSSPSTPKPTTHVAKQERPTKFQRTVIVDFDGTCTGITGVDLFSQFGVLGILSPPHDPVRNPDFNDVMLDTDTPHQTKVKLAEVLFSQLPKSLQELASIQPKAIRFLAAQLADPSVNLVICSRNYGPYIQALLKYQAGLTDDQISKITILDRDYVGQAQQVTGKIGKEAALSQYLKDKDPVSLGRCYVCDDDKNDLKAMKKALDIPGMKSVQATKFKVGNPAWNTVAAQITGEKEKALARVRNAMFNNAPTHTDEEALKSHRDRNKGEVPEPPSTPQRSKS